MQKSLEGRPRPKKPSRREISIKARILAVSLVLGEKEAKRWTELHAKKPWYRGRYRTFPGNGSGGAKRAGTKLVKKMLKCDGIGAGWKHSRKIRKQIAA